MFVGTLDFSECYNIPMKSAENNCPAWAEWADWTKCPSCKAIGEDEHAIRYRLCKNGIPENAGLTYNFTVADCEVELGTKSHDSKNCTIPLCKQ